jgi:hypothetical protein
MENVSYDFPTGSTYPEKEQDKQPEERTYKEHENVP